MEMISGVLKNAEAQIQSKLSWIFSSSNKEVPIEKKEIALGPREIYDYFKIKDKNKKEELKKFYFYIVENKIITDKNIDFYESFRRFNAEVKSQKKFAGDYSTYLITSSPISTPLVNSIGNTSQGNTNTMSSTSSVSGNASFYKKKKKFISNLKNLICHLSLQYIKLILVMQLLIKSFLKITNLKCLVHLFLLFLLIVELMNMQLIELKRGMPN